jgi:DDE_Tnp_1-associated
MSLAFSIFEDRSRLKALLDHFAVIDDPRDARPLAEALLLVVCGTMADCDGYGAIVASGEAHLAFLRRYLPYHFGAPCGRWLTRLMNRVNPALFSAASPPGCARPGRTARIRRRSTARPRAAPSTAPRA